MIVLGLMSGTSLDGIDLALCEFSNGGSTYKLLAAETVAYDASWVKKLSQALTYSAQDFVELDYALGKHFAYVCNDFILKHRIKPDLIASHGHTIFHQPEKGFTSQIGHGSQVYAICKLPVVSDFRSVDIGLGGQGAPLVPIGDSILFKDYGYALNLGGIANITIHKQDDTLTALDICPFNQVLNHLANKMGCPYDEGGKLAAKGDLIVNVFQELEALDFFSQEGNKSLGREWIDEHYLPVVNGIVNIEDALHTATQHMSLEIAKQIKKEEAINDQILYTGGGAFNNYFIRTLQSHLPNHTLVVADKALIEFKEAIIFALLGYLRVHKKTNTLAAATGASTDSIGGAVYGM